MNELTEITMTANIRPVQGRDLLREHLLTAAQQRRGTTHSGKHVR
jgi:hypothetical protein